MNIEEMRTIAKQVTLLRIALQEHNNPEEFISQMCSNYLLLLVGLASNR